MKLKSIKIELTPEWQRKTFGEYRATAEVEAGSYGDAVTINVDPQRCEQIVDILAGAVAESMARAAGEFAKEVQAKISGKLVEHDALPNADGATAA